MALSKAWRVIVVLAALAMLAACVEEPSGGQSGESSSPTEATSGSPSPVGGAECQLPSASGSWVLANSLAAPVDGGSGCIEFVFGDGKHARFSGDWDGNGSETGGVFHSGVWALSNSLQPETATSDRIRFRFGNSNFVPVAGDWNKDGFDTVGVYQPDTGEWVLTNSLQPDVDAESERIRFTFGGGGYIPVVGDWDGDGVDTPGLFDSGRWVLTDSLQPDVETLDRIRFQPFGSKGFSPLAGDWNGDGSDTPGVYQRGTGRWVLTNSLQPHVDPKTDRIEFVFGGGEYVPVVGDWDGDGNDSPGVVAD